jgi:hypothetical protein
VVWCICRQQAPPKGKKPAAQPAAAVQQQQQPQHKGGAKQPSLKELVKQSKNAKKRCEHQPVHSASRPLQDASSRRLTAVEQAAADNKQQS